MYSLHSQVLYYSATNIIPEPEYAFYIVRIMIRRDVNISFPKIHRTRMKYICASRNILVEIIGCRIFRFCERVYALHSKKDNMARLFYVRASTRKALYMMS